MGCVPGDGECGPGEKPAHRVMISKPFEIAESETTNAQYEGCVDSGTCRRVPVVGNATHPVVGVTWGDAATFCKWAGGRLPTEAEWEYAGRGGRPGYRFPWGNEESPDRANFQSGLSRAVKSFEPNGFGLFDVSGNVWEWCEDLFDESYYGRSPERDPKGPTEGKTRALRGGSWYNSGDQMRLSFRTALDPSTRLGYVGFRCAQ